VRIDVVDLPNTTLGIASSKVIFLDADAAGHGWFVDATPWDNTEFVTGRGKGLAGNRVDLFTVLAHELGHVLGFDDEADLNSVMGGTLGVGTRRTPAADPDWLEAMWSDWDFSADARLRKRLPF